MLRIAFRSGLLAVLLGILAVPSVPATGQESGAAPEPAGIQAQLEAIQKRLENEEHRLDVLDKQIDDVLWIQRLGDLALVDKVRLTGPPPAKEPNPTAIGAGNPLKFYAYVFLPRDLDRSRKAPLLVFPHGGVHSDFSTYYIHIVRELMAQGYVVVAPEYRGSTGYGRDHYEHIDYGGLEIEDAQACRQYMLENYDFLDAGRVGILGWSHGGLISLMTIFDHPDDYQVAYAGVPVSDLVMRMGYHGEDYLALYSADYHIGQTVQENLPEYKRRSPVWNVDKLRTPLLIHTNTNDEDVNVIEVEHLIQALKAAGKTFESEVFKDLPGGHSFNRLDTKQAQEIRLKIYRFLARYLKPPHPFQNWQELHAAGYR